MVDKVRRVITGQTPEGKSVFSHVEEVRRRDLQQGMKWYGVWGWDELPTLPYLYEGSYEPRSVFPGKDGMRINAIVFPPQFGLTQTGDPMPSEEMMKLAKAQDPGGVHPDPETGMHWTNTIDFGIVIEGELVSIQDDGAEVTLRQGDLYVQNGAMHAWQNRTDKPCTIYILNLGVPRAEGGEPTGGK
ncbi:cupin domain-containing protein [Novosphingobium malaysiense]|uniref:Cupin type-2 domain-containing protein n=1 Tax=Novosphingobium malaysiense TaxID=1348853 RepID=A0A0B1ZLZ1_9SPHN|nr:cupin domain-containing protein [Novosphingobium malaysiense]KHK90359.1 hypothetical protein LK12_17335 [Novosphingobium malaysiense]